MRRLLAVAVLAGALAVANPTGAGQRCFGAAARDSLHPCENPALRYAARPGAETALLTPNEPCETTARFGNPHRRASGTMYTCEFGYPAEGAKRTVALIGDSHSMSWRAAVAGTLRRLHWHGVALARSHCAFTTARRAFGPAEVAGCARFNRRVVDWLTDHPEVTAAFVAHQNGGTPYVTERGLSEYETQIQGFATAWHALPASITEVFAIRDNPLSHGAIETARCARRARRADVDASVYCERSRTDVLLPDAYGDTVARLKSSRYSLIDLTRFMCDASHCFPIVGGALVNKDGDHLTRLFSATLAPYMLRRVRAVLRR